MNRMASRAATALTAVALAVVASIAPQATVSAAFTGWHGTTDGAPVTVTLGGNGFPGIVGFECQQEIRYGVEVTTQVRATVTIENANNVKRAFHDVSRDPFVGDWLADGSGTCKVIVQQARGQTGTASVRIWASPNDPVVMAADGTPIALVVSIPTQFSRATFPCTKGVQYPISLASTLPTSAYTARVFVPATATSWTNRTFQTSVKVTPKATGTCSVNFDPKGTTLGSAMVTVQGPSTPEPTVPGPTVVNPRDITVATTADSTPVSLDVTVRTQLARVYFPCTMGTHYVVGLVTDLSQKSYVAGLYVPNGSGKWTKQVISTLGDSTPKGDGNCWVYFDPKGTTLGKATITIQTAPLLTTPAPTDGTPVTVTTTIPTQNARATFACTKSARYGVELATSLPKSQYVARAYLPTGPDKWENKTFSTTIEVVPKADGTCYVYFDPKGATLATATIMVWGSTAVTADAVTDGTPVTVTTLVPTQNAAVTFPCTNKVRYGIELTSTLPKNGYTVYVLNATSAQQKITPETQSTPGFVGHWVSDSDGSCRIVFNPNGTAVGSATIRIWGVAP